MDHLFPYPKMGSSWLEILEDPLTRKLLGHEAIHAEKTAFITGVTSRLTFLLNDATKHLSFLKIGYTALEAFLQANATGPPLDFDSIPLILPELYRDEAFAIQQDMLRGLTVDGEAAYSLIPRVELFWLAKVIMSNATLAEAGFNGRRARLRVNFWHQKLLSEKSDSLHEQLYTDAEVLDGQLSARYKNKSAASEEHLIEFLTERAAIRIFYGDDGQARQDLERAASIRGFSFALTGALGKRTRYQHRDVSQLLVLAKSRDFEPEPYNSRKSSRAEGSSSRKSSWAGGGPRSPTTRPRSPSHLSVRRTSVGSVASSTSEIDRPLSPLSTTHGKVPATTVTQPESLLLNDDTVLEKIAFHKPGELEPQLTTVSDENSLSPELAALDPTDQPQLFPMDSIILLSTASSISNDKPADGLTREETLPYAVRVLEGGSSNWQVYTQALLVRSRIEGYKTRTMERGLLQLQALVDQVIAETSEDIPTTRTDHEVDSIDPSAPSTFLPKPKASESASVAERLKYIYQISPPLRWELEAELAQRWTQMGGLKTALEIYQRLQMKAEVALCLAATDQEAEAVKLLKDALFDNAEAQDSATRKLISPPPTDAARLLCILGDIEQNPNYYALAWTVSNKRYARAQRSLGRYYMKQKDFKRSAEAYSAAVGVSRLDNSTWFALGCVQIQLQDWSAAVESFIRVVQLEDQDAEGWSNLAIALLRLPPPTVASSRAQLMPADNEDEETTEGRETADGPDPLQHTREALRALRRAAGLKREDARIWDNYLTVAASIPPSQGTPWNELIHAMSRVIELREKKEGEAAIDMKVLNVLVRYVTENYDYPKTGGDDEAEVGNANDDMEKDDNAKTKEEHAPAADTTATTAGSDESSNTTLQPVPTTEPSSTKTQLPFLPRALLKMVDTQIAPLATSSPTLFQTLSKISLWRHKPSESLSYAEKSWRSTTTQPQIYETLAGWKDVVTQTLSLVQTYRSLGEQTRERTGGMVEKNWRFKSKSAVRGVLGKGKELWEFDRGEKDEESGSYYYGLLKSELEQLSSTTT